MPEKVYIERDELLEKAKCTDAYFQIKSIVSGMRGVDAVEVVRCKDCAHWGGTTFGFICRKFSGSETKICMSADSFCSYGERKGAENG